MMTELFLVIFGLAALIFGFKQLFAGGGELSGNGPDSMHDLRRSHFIHTTDDTLEEMGYKDK